jgi:hypothetical protein
MEGQGGGEAQEVTDPHPTPHPQKNITFSGDLEVFWLVRVAILQEAGPRPAAVLRRAWITGW